MVWLQLDYQGMPYTINMDKVLAARPSERPTSTQLIFAEPLWNGERKMTFSIPYGELSQFLQNAPDPLNTYDSEGLGHVV